MNSDTDAHVLLRPELYFVKVDVKSCFDTIKQDKLLALVEDILSEVNRWFLSLSFIIIYTESSCYRSDSVLHPKLLASRSILWKKFSTIQIASLWRR